MTTKWTIFEHNVDKIAALDCRVSNWRCGVVTKHGLKFVIVAGLVLSGPAQAAKDAGLRLLNNQDARVRSSLGGQLGMTLRLGSKQAVKGSDRFNLRLGVGPMASTSNGRRSAANLLSVSLSPGYKTELSYAGSPLVTRYTGAGLVEEAARELDSKYRQGVSALGYVAIGVGVLATVVVVAGALVIADINDCSDGNCE